MTKPLVDGFCEPEFSKLEDIFVKSIQSGFDDGAGFALEVEGKEVLNLWGGFSDRERKKNWQEDTLVNVFSVTKAMTSTCALQLIESGKLEKILNFGLAPMAQIILKLTKLWHS